MKIEMWPIDQIVPYEKNPRKNDNAVKDVMNSIDQFGFRQPIVIDKKNVIIVGHTRWKAAKELGLREVPVHVADLTPAQAQAYRITDNKVGEKSIWDDALLKDELLEIKDSDIDLQGLGFSESELRNILGDERDPKEDEVPETAPARVKRGEIWLCGESRVMCGDSTSEVDVARLMNGEKADMVFTSPPYNANTAFRNTNNNGKLYENYSDNLSENDYLQFVSKVLKNSFQYCNGFIFWNVNYNSNTRNGFIRQIIPYLDKLNETICWKKTALPVPHGLTRTWEPIFVFHVDGTKKRIGKSNRCEFNFWEINNCGNLHSSHRATFPVALPEKGIELVDPKIVADFFGGSGTTLIACENLNRKCRMMEIDPKYCDVILTRWENVTGFKAEKWTGKKSKGKAILCR